MGITTTATGGSIEVQTARKQFVSKTTKIPNNPKHQNIPNIFEQNQTIPNIPNIPKTSKNSKNSKQIQKIKKFKKTQTKSKTNCFRAVCTVSCRPPPRYR